MFMPDTTALEAVLADKRRWGWEVSKTVVPWMEINRDGEVSMGEAPVRGYLEMLQIAGAVISAVNAVLKEYGVTEAEAAAIGKQLAKLAGQLR
jgi:hypothetical protein